MKRVFWFGSALLGAAVFVSPVRDALVLGGARAYSVAHRAVVAQAQSQVAQIDEVASKVEREAEEMAVLATVASTESERQAFDRKQRDDRSIKATLEVKRGEELIKVRNLEEVASGMLAASREAFGHPQVKPVELARRVIDSEKKRALVQAKFEAVQEDQQAMKQRFAALAQQLEDARETLNLQISNAEPTGTSSAQSEIQPTSYQVDRILKIRDTGK